MQHRLWVKCQWAWINVKFKQETIVVYDTVKKCYGLAVVSMYALLILGGSCRPCCRSFNVHTWQPRQQICSKLAVWILSWNSSKKGFRTFPEAIKHRRRYFSRPIYIWIGKKSILLLKFWSLWTIPDNRCEFLIDHKIFKLKCSTRREIKNINVRKMLWIFFT